MCGGVAPGLWRESRTFHTRAKWVLSDEPELPARVLLVPFGLSDDKTSVSYCREMRRKGAQDLQSV